MEYLLAWRMAVAKDLLRREDLAVGDVAERVGYGYGEHVQHGIQPTRRPASESLRRNGENPTNVTSRSGPVSGRFGR